MSRHRLLLFLLCLVAAISLVIGQGFAQSPPNNGILPNGVTRTHMTNAQHIAAAQRAAAKRLASGEAAPVPVLDPLGVPDYFNVPNWTNSPLLHKFVDTLPGLGAANANNLGNYIPIAIADTTTYPGSDYYQIGVKDYTQQFHTDLPATTQLRGYIDLNPAADGKNHYLGPLIIAHKGTPSRIKFTNLLPIGTAGNLHLPVDTTIMGAGTGPLAMSGNLALYNQNRAVIHLHGGDNPWISDGTPHQWITPAGDPTPYKKGESAHNVPDMQDPGDGSSTFYYPNGLSSRLVWFHDHSFGLTRLNVYAGETAGYLLTDPIEEDLISTQKVLPDLGGVYHYGIPLILQDKTFVPDPVKLAATDPTWDTANWGGLGNLWFPHVYMPNQNPADASGANGFGRWDYGPWFWPPVNFLNHGPITLPSGIQTPGTPNPSMTMESFQDTPIVNGAAYPKFTVDRKAYRFRILNASNERFFNLQLYYVDPLHPTEVKMVPAVPHPNDPNWPATWPTDGRDGGVPDPATAGPDIIQIGTEAGLLPNPVVIPSTPVNYNYNRRDIVVLNVSTHGLLLGPAERADVIVDFSKVPAGSNIILYNDAGAPVPAFDTRYDYYTGDPDQTSTGGAPTTLEGFGPNTRTIMLFNVSTATAAPAFDLTALQTALPVAYAASQPAHLVPQVADGATNNTYANIQDNTLTFTPIGSTTSVTIDMKSKAIQELFELDYGRMNSTLGTELPLTNFLTQTTIPLAYIDPATEILKDGETQIWKITHNGVDTHAIHFHLVNVQLINRVGWDGAKRPPAPNELGWKETLLMHPLEDCIIAVKGIKPVAPFEIPDSIRRMDVTMPLGSTLNFTQIDPYTNLPKTVTNKVVNFGHEYVWHCHLLGHEEMDMMRPVILQVAPGAPILGRAAQTGPGTVTMPFTAPINTGGSPIDHYVLSTLPATTETMVLASPAIKTGLKPGVSYVLVLKAINGVGRGPSAQSNSVTISTGPIAPSSFVVTPNPASNNAASVVTTWTNVGTNQTGLTIQVSTSSTFATIVQTIAVTPGTATTKNITGLQANTLYYFRIASKNVQGLSPWIKTSATTAGQLPGAPTLLKLGTVETTNIVMSWKNNTGIATGIYVEIKVGAGPWTRIVPSLAPNVNSYDATGLTTKTPYQFRVQAFNATGVSPYSNIISATTL
ncbi:MAG: fibronectin type III domain-containing protein [bacterium]